MSQITKQHIPILMYHSISEATAPFFRPYAVPRAMFELQMRYLHEQGYVSLTVTQLINRLSQQPCILPERLVVLTFDDGYADFYHDAVPVMQKYGFVATIYITTGYVGGTSEWMMSRGEGMRPMLTWEQIVELHKMGIEVGAHTHTHPQLDLIPLAKARQEILQSKDLLEQHLQQPVLSFAYSHGYHTGTIKRILKQAGFTSACAVRYEMSHTDDDHFALARLLAGPDTGVEELKALLATPLPSVPLAIYRKAAIPAWRGIRAYRSFKEKRLRAKEGVQA